jgi:cytochrome c-type biogenesis protein CcmE
MAKKSRFVIGVGLMAAAIAYLIFFAVRQTAEYYVTVNELHQRRGELTGQMIRVAGRVQPEAIGWDASSLTLSFAIAQPPDGTNQPPSQPQLTPVVASAPVAFRVVSRGQPKPDMFAPGRDVIVEGRLGADNTIEARQVLTSCPSKYVPKDPANDVPKTPN